MSKERVSDNFFFQTVKCAVLAVFLCFCFASLTAAVAGFVAISASAVKIVGAAAKVVSVLLAALFSLRGEKCFFKGLIAGVLFAAVTFVLFSSFSGTGITVKIFLHLLLGGIAGALSGSLAFFVKSRA